MAAKDTVEKVEVPLRTTESMSLKVLSSHEHGSMDVASNIENNSIKVL